MQILKTSNCNFDFYVTLHFTDYILWIKHKTLIKYQYILLVNSTFYYILFFDSSESRNNTFKHQFVCHLSVNICSEPLESTKYHIFMHRFTIIAMRIIGYKRQLIAGLIYIQYIALSMPRTFDDIYDVTQHKSNQINPIRRQHF